MVVIVFVINVVIVFVSVLSSFLFFFMSVFAFFVRLDLVLSSILLDRGPLPVGEIGKVTLTP